MSRPKKVTTMIMLLFMAAFLSVQSCEKRIQQSTAPQGRPDLPGVSIPSPPREVLFLSTQMNPVEEAGRMRNVILKDFPGSVDFKPNDNSFLFRQIDSLEASGSDAAILLGALHGDLVTLYEEEKLLPLNEFFGGLGNRSFAEPLVQLGRLDGTNLYYIPWTQASFVMAVNKKALQYLPAGSHLDSMTYEQLLQWVKNIHDRTGKKALGFPAGEKGLMHRFFQGYLYPSFTGNTLLKFRGPDAVTMWKYFKELWGFAHPGSLVYSTMSEPLLTEDVWIAWDHTARLMKAFQEQPDTFVAFPAPSGPSGLGFMTVISGLSIPRGTSDTRSPELLIDYLTLPAIQARTLRETGFFPVVEIESESDIPRHLLSLYSAMKKQGASSNAIPTLPPVGLGEQGGEYNRLFMLAFSEIVLDGKEITAVLDGIAKELQRIAESENLRCWPPDVSEERPLHIE